MASKSTTKDASEKEQATPVVNEDAEKEQTSTAPSEAKAAADTSSVSKYTIEELTAAEKELGANRVIIRTALRKADKKLFTLAEAREIVKAFKEKEVK